MQDLKNNTTAGGTANKSKEQLHGLLKEALTLDLNAYAGVYAANDLDRAARLLCTEVLLNSPMAEDGIFYNSPKLKELGQLLLQINLQVDFLEKRVRPLIKEHLKELYPWDTSKLPY